MKEVATREGGVDRNVQGLWNGIKGILSPPARVAWIETRNRKLPQWKRTVATREGGVDRNHLL